MTQNAFGVSVPPPLRLTRLIITVDLPPRLDSRSITEVCALTASRLRWRLSQEYKAQTRARVEARYAHKAATG